MYKTYSQPHVELIGHLHDLTLISCGSAGAALHKSIAPSSDGIYCTQKGKKTPLHS